MAEIEIALLERFYQEFWLFLALFVLTGAIAIVLFIICSINLHKITKIYRIGFLAVIVLMVGLCVFSGTYFSKYYKDRIFLKSSTPICLVGKVTGYSHATSSDDLTVTRSWPIILNEETKTQIFLNVINSEEKLVIGQVYEFLYLPNTRIAEIVE